MYTNERQLDAEVFKYFWEWGGETTILSVSWLIDCLFHLSARMLLIGSEKALFNFL